MYEDVADDLKNFASKKNLSVNAFIANVIGELKQKGTYTI